MEKTQMDRLTALIKSIRYGDDLYVDKDGTQTITRDKTQITSDDQISLGSSYRVQIWNTVRAAYVLLDIYQDAFGDDAQDILIARKTLEATQKNIELMGLGEASDQRCLDELKVVNAEVLTVLKSSKLGAKFKEREAVLLSVAKNYTGLEDGHPNVLTILPVQDEGGLYYGQYSKPLCTLTDGQKEQYASTKEQDWFKKLPRYKQQLVERYKDVITDGKHVLPTQIRDIPGLRNGYTTTIIKCDKDGKNQDPLYAFTHSGSVAGFSTDFSVNNKLALENLEQLQAAVVKDMHFVILNSKSNKEDSQCVTQTQMAQASLLSNAHESVRVVENSASSAEGLENTRAAARNVVATSNSPLNIFRLFVDSDYSAIISQLGCVSQDTPDDLRDIKRYLSDKKIGVYSKAVKELDGVVDLESKKLLNSAVELKRLVMRYSGFSGKIATLFAGYENPSLQIDRKLMELQQDIEAFMKNVPDVNSQLSQQNIREHCIHIACKSGKDRTGLVGFVAAVDVIKRDLKHSHGEYKSEVLIANSADLIARSGHVQFLAGVSGGTPGCIGLKPLLFSIPKTLGSRVGDVLQLEASNFNNVVPTPRQTLKSFLNALVSPIYWLKDKVSNMFSRSAGYDVLQPLTGCKDSKKVAHGEAVLLKFSIDVDQDGVASDVKIPANISIRTSTKGDCERGKDVHSSAVSRLGSENSETKARGI